MKVLVTGAAGFIGSHLVEYLVEKGYDVRAFFRYSSSGSRGWLDDSPLAGNFEAFFGDIRDYDSVRLALSECDGVFHLASLIGIPYSYQSPLAYIRTNVEGTYNVVENARYLGTGRILCTSTSEVYGTARYVPIDESHPLQPQSPYSASKISADQIALSFYNSFDLPVSLARPFNTYGPRQSARAIIPTIISQALAGRKTIRLGSLTPTRDLNFVRDTVTGMEQIFKEPSFIGKAVNISSQKEISVGDLAATIGKLCDLELSIQQEELRMRPEKSEVERLLGDSSVLRQTTGWAPGITLQEGLVQTIQWFKSHKLRTRPDEYVV